MIERIGQCKYCAQAGIVKTSGNADEQTITQAVTSQCTCSQAIRERALEKGKERLERICGENASKAGFVPVEESVAASLLEAYALVATSKINAFSLQVMDSKIDISWKGEKLKVDRKRIVQIHG